MRCDVEETFLSIRTLHSGFKNFYLDYSIAEIRSKYVDKQLTRSGNMPTTPKSSRTDKRMRPGELKRKRKAALHAIGKLQK